MIISGIWRNYKKNQFAGRRIGAHNKNESLSCVRISTYHELISTHKHICPPAT